MKPTPPLQSQAQQQQLLLLQHAPPSQQQLGQTLQHQQLGRPLQQQQPMLGAHNQPLQLQQPMLEHHQQLLLPQQQQPMLQQQQQQQQRRMNPVQGVPHQHPQQLPPQQMHMQHLQHQQQPYLHHSSLQQQFVQQAQLQLQQLPQQLQQQQLQLQQQHALPNIQRHFLHQQQPQLYGLQQPSSTQRPQSTLQPHQQLQHQQLQHQQLQQLHLQQQQQLLHHQQLQQHEGLQPSVHPAVSPTGSSSSNSSSNSSSVGVMRASPMGTGQPQVGRMTPQGPLKPIPTAAAGLTPGPPIPIDAVQIAARPGSALTVADLVREAMEAAEAAEYEPDSYGEVREANEGFSEDDLLDFTEDVAALMEAFLNPSVAVAAQTLEVTVQLALDFIDELVAKALEARRQHEDGIGNPQEGARFQPQLQAEDLLAALSSHPRKALRCREALENYRQLEEFKCAFPEDRYLSPPPSQTQPPVSPQGVKTAGTSSSGGPSTEGQPQQGQNIASSQQAPTPQYEAAHGIKRTSPQTAGAYSNPATQIMRTQQRDAGLETGLSFAPAAASALPLGI